VSARRSTALAACALAACALASGAPACAPAAPGAQRADVVVALVDSVPYANELTEGVLRRVAVRAGGRVDTVADVLVAEAPVLAGDTLVVGVAAEEDRVAGLFVHDVRAGRTRRVALPPGLVPHGRPALSPDGRHLAYLAQTPEGMGYGAVATVPAGRVILRGPPAPMLETDAGVDGVAWSDAARFEIRVDLSYRVGGTQRLRGTVAPPRLEVDTIRGAPR
jgi:hypothetical protein